MRLTDTYDAGFSDKYELHLLMQHISYFLMLYIWTGIAVVLLLYCCCIAVVLPKVYISISDL